MALPCNYYVFENVNDVESFLTNLKDCASDNGWTIDKDDISNSGELYLHSNHLGRNLYYSMKGHLKTIGDCSFYRLSLYANRGFDETKAVNEQPGQWNPLPGDSSGSNGEFKLFFPMRKQYVLANEQALFVFYDCYKSEAIAPTGLDWTSDIFPDRLILGMGIGGIDLYNESDTEGNFLFFDFIEIRDEWGNQIIPWMESGSLGSRREEQFCLLYGGENAVTRDKFGLSVGWQIVYQMDWNPNYITHLKPCDSHWCIWGKHGFRYGWAVVVNQSYLRLSLIKPIVSIYETDETNEYFYPIGEMPYYACKGYPYTKAGDIMQFGTRKFVAFPLLNYTEEAIAIAVEVQ